MSDNKPAKQVKYIFVTGGVLSGLGKGITAASIGNILKNRGLSVNMQKFDQYINVDAGTLNPAEHGEVYVTDDGAECDLDLGHYERFLDENLTHQSSVMTGEIYQEVINRERRGDYLGKTVQVIPHVSGEVKRRAREAAYSNGYDIQIVEIGGTVGDNEGFHFIEGARQMRLDEGPANVLYIHVVFLPYLKASDEVKTKPAQNSVRELRSIGIQPDILIARTDHEVPAGLVEKLSLYTNVEPRAILPLVTVPSVYEVPQIMEEHGLDEVIADKLGLGLEKNHNQEWRAFVEKIKREKEKVTIGMVGKYTTMLDTYASVIEALKHAAWFNDRDLVLRWIDAEELEAASDPAEMLDDVDGILVPGGFGIRGTEGKIRSIQYARENNIPYFGLCLGMQLATIEFARNVAGIKQATSEEFLDEEKEKGAPHLSASAKRPTHLSATTGLSPTTPIRASVQQDTPQGAPAQRNFTDARRGCVIHIMEDQKVVQDKGGTMRLGGWDCVLDKDSKSYQAYGTTEIRERHRHRYEFNNDFREQLEEAGLRLAGTTPDGKLVEIIEVKDHPWFVAVQFHPEFTSRPLKGQPLFNSFLAAAAQPRK